MELRWDGVPTLADAMRMLRDQAQRTPPPQWVRVTGGWGEFQFAERRMPTLDEINAAAPDTPVFVLHLYDRAILNGAALRAVGYTKDTPDPPGSEIQRDRNGNPTGVLIARPNAGLLYATLGKGPKLSHEDQVNSSRHFMREMNRFGLTSIVDAGGGSQAYPEDYQVIEELNRQDQLTLRLAYNLFTQKPKGEFEDFSRFVRMLKPGQGSDVYRVNGAGEMLVYSAADFEDFLEPRPDFAPSMEDDLKRVVRLLAENKWPFRIHATFDESITRMLNVFEEVNREVPFQARWFFDHAETISDRNLERVKALKGGIAIQCRMAFQGEYCIDRYGKKATERTPPIRRMLEMGIPVGAGTDATRVATYNPFIALYWLVSGKTVGGTTMYPAANRMTREEALRLYTVGSSWFSSEEGKKGSIEPGQLADLAVLSADYFSVPEEQIKRLESVLTVMGGKVVYAAEEFSKLAPPLPPVSPDWSPVAKYGGYARRAASGAPAHHSVRSSCSHLPRFGWAGFPEGIGCPCFAF
jgi:predicted amidohydrolase YtcJ